MPQVKIDHIVSFSSEDPGRPAKSLCDSEIGVGWRSSVCERTSSVVCGLRRAVHISSITVGAVNVALLEVLVGRSAQPDHYEVLVPRSVVVPPLESRRGGGGEKVRTWGRDLLTDQTRGQLWDRIKLVCSQPYDKQAQFGISFVHVFSPEEAGANHTSAGKEVIRDTGDIGALGEEQEEEEFTPGELWRRHTATTAPPTHTNTGAQIRQATSQALKNVLSETHSLVKSKLNNEKRTSHSHTSEQKRQRDRDNLIYDSDDDKPNDKIDNAVNKHRKEKESVKQQKNQANTSTKDNQSNRNERENKCERDGNKGKERHNEKEEDKMKKSNENNEESRSFNKKREMKRGSQDRSSSSTDKDTQRKRTKTDESRNKTEVVPPLAGVVFAISGYVNPRRGDLRGGAVRLGGAYSPDLSARVTHLLAAYHNTPKVRAAAPGTVVVLGEWIDECVRRQERVHPGPYLTDPKQRTKNTDTPGLSDVVARPSRRRSPSSGSDTDDDIQRILHTAPSARGGTAPSTSSTGGATSRDSESDLPTKHTPSERTGSGDDTREAETETKDEEDVTESTGDNILKCSGWSPDDSAAGDTEGEVEGEEVDREERGELPDLLGGRLVRVRGGRRDLLERYVTAYGGTIAHECGCEDAEVYVCGAGGVTPSWVWDLHYHRLLPDTTPYLISGE